MAMTPTDSLPEWRIRLAQALQASLSAMDARLPAAEIARREEGIRALEREGRARGFLLVDRNQRHPITVPLSIR